MSLSGGWFCITCHFSIRMFFKHGSDGSNCVTKGRIPLCALRVCVRAFFLSSNLTSEMILSTRLLG